MKPLWLTWQQLLGQHLCPPSLLHRVQYTTKTTPTHSLLRLKLSTVVWWLHFSCSSCLCVCAYGEQSYYAIKKRLIKTMRKRHRLSYIVTRIVSHHFLSSRIKQTTYDTKKDGRGSSDLKLTFICRAHTGETSSHFAALYPLPSTSVDFFFKF